MSSAYATRIVEKVFKEFDKDCNGRLSKVEFPKAINNLSRATGGSICSKDDLHAIFDLIDINGDNTISKKEMEILFCQILELLKKNGDPAYNKMVKFSE
jgi:Ca2+-binding EF-hand superfamily protein